MALTDSQYQAMSASQIKTYAANGANVSNYYAGIATQPSEQQAWKTAAGAYAFAGQTGAWGDLKIADTDADTALAGTVSISIPQTTSFGAAPPPVPQVSTTVVTFKAWIKAHLAIALGLLLIFILIIFLIVRRRRKKKKK